MIEWGCISYDKRGGNGEKYMVFELQDEGGATVGAYDLLTDAKINMEAERSRRKNILTDIQRETEILFRWGLKMLELVRSFKYLVRAMDKSDNYWTKICANIRLNSVQMCCNDCPADALYMDYREEGRNIY